MGVLFGAPRTEAERPRQLLPAAGCQTKEVRKGRSPELIAEPARADPKGQAREGIYHRFRRRQPHDGVPSRAAFRQGDLETWSVAYIRTPVGISKLAGSRTSLD